MMNSGEVYNTKNGPLEIISYKDCYNVRVRFIDTGYETIAQAGHISKGSVKDKFYKSVQGIGFQGVGPHPTKPSYRPYRLWVDLFNRCYGGLNKPYLGCSVDQNMHNFQEFAEWCQWQVGFCNEGWHLDKDILYPNNRVYSLESCVFVPREINNAFVNTKGALGYCLSKSGTFMVYCAGNYVGSFKTKEDASLKYKEIRGVYLKNLADKWQKDIDERLYYSLINYKD